MTRYTTTAERQGIRIGVTLAASLVLFAAASATILAQDEGFTIYGDYYLAPDATLTLDRGTIKIAGDFDCAIDDSSRFDLTNVKMQFIGLSSSPRYSIEAISEDIGFCDLTLPDPGLFSIEEMQIGPLGIDVEFTDNHDNAPGAGNEALYVETLRFESGTSLDVRGLNLYYITVIPANAGDPGSGVTITDSVGGGGIFALGTDSPVTPTDPGTSDNEICDGDSTTLFATALPGLVIDWYTDDCGISPSNRPLGTFVGTGSPLAVSPLDTTVYWAQSRNPATGCISRICSDSVTVIVHDNPLCTISSDAIVCTGASELTATVQDAGANTTYDWSVTGGTITGGQNTPTITYIADDVGTILLEVTVDKTYSDGDGSTCQTYCQLTIYTDRYVWTGPDGALFTDTANWDLNIVPGSIPPGGDAILTNTTGVDNRCVLDDPGGLHVMCNVKVQATGLGKQILRIDAGSTLTTTVATLINAGGEVNLRGGTLDGGTVYNSGTSLTGYGRVTADIENTGLIESRPGESHILRLLGDSFDNAGSGLMRASLGTLVLVEGMSVQQAADIEIQTLSGIDFAVPLINQAGGLITLYNGSLGAGGVTNEAGATIFGFGTIQSSLINNGDMITIADAQIIGNVHNDGTITIQSGLLTVTGTLTGGGTIIGGFGGRDGDGCGELNIAGSLLLDATARLNLACGRLILAGDFDTLVQGANQIDLRETELVMGNEAEVMQTIEVFSTDSGRGVTLPSPTVASIGVLRTTGTRASLRLVDRHANTPAATGEALYVGRLVLAPGTTLDLAGRTLYYGEIIPSDPWHDGGVEIVDGVGGGRLVALTNAEVQKKQGKRLSVVDPAPSTKR